MADKEFNPYEILGVDKETPAEDIKKAYREKSKELHPDRSGSDEDFTNLKKAYDILSDPAKRSLYDDYGINDFIDIENEAKLVAVQIVVSSMEGLPEFCDMDKEISDIFNRCLDGLTAQELAEKKARDKIQRRFDAIQKKPVNDFLSNEILKVIEAHNKAIKLAQLNYRIHDTAFRLVKEYKFDITKIAFTKAAEINSNPLAKAKAEARAGGSARSPYREPRSWSL